jgi:hypothetical protein
MQGWEKWFRFVDEVEGVKDRDYQLLKRENFSFGIKYVDPMNEYAAGVIKRFKPGSRNFRRRVEILNIVEMDQKKILQMSLMKKKTANEKVFRELIKDEESQINESVEDSVESEIKEEISDGLQILVRVQTEA